VDEEDAGGLGGEDELGMRVRDVDGLDVEEESEMK